MHDTFQLALACSKDSDISKNNLLGVFAADRIPSPIPYFCRFIMNTDTHGEEGEHWVAIFCKGGKIFILIRMMEMRFMVMKTGDNF